MKANELRSSLLKSGMDPQAAEDIVKGQIAAGGLEPEETVVGEGAESLDALEKAASDIVTSWDEPQTETTVEVEEEDSTEIVKSFGDEDHVADDDFEDITEIITEFAKASDTIAGAVVDRYESLAKATKASADAVNTLAKSIWSMKADLEKAVGEVHEMRAAMNLPVPPRAVTNEAEEIAAPGEATGGEAVITKGQVVAQALTELQDADVTQDRRYQLTKAMAQLDTFANPADIAKQFGITIQ